MKKNKKLLLFGLLIFFMQLFVAGAVVERVFYHTGVDFVQLYFKTNGAVSIPDLFYPEKGNRKHLIMRVNDIEFKDNKTLLTFNSPIVKNIRLIKKKDYYDIEINLKESVNYKVSANTKGLFIEFPNVKKVFVGKVKKNENKKLNKSIISSNKLIKVYAKNNLLKDFEIIEKTKDNLKIKFNMTANHVKHEIIEVNKKPYRLALDLINTRSRRISKRINSFNVNKLRGASNRKDVFRLVFDLNALKNFKVTEGNKSLIVEFFNKAYKKNIIVKNDTINGNVKSKNSVNVITNLDSLNSKQKTNSNNLIVKGEKKLKVIPAIKSVKLTNDEYFTEPTSQTSKDETDNFMEVEDKDGNIKKGVITVHGGAPKYTGSPITLNVKNADLANVINSFSEMAKINIILDPGVTGKVTANIKDVPWDQALDLFLKINGLGKVVEGNILRIGKVSVLANEAVQLKKLEMAKASVEEMIVKNYRISYAKANELSKIVKEQLSNRGRIYVDARTNTIIVTDIADKIKIIDNLIDLLDAANAQVSIEAKIIETNVNYYNALGIQWGYNVIADAAHGNPTSLKFPNSIGVGGNMINDKTAPGVSHSNGLGGYAINLPAPTFNTGTAFTFGNVADTFRLDLALTAMESSGKGKILSSPKTTTQDNLKAKISQGNKIPVQTVQNNTVSVRYIDAVLELEVTPQITAKGTIKMELKIKNDNPDWTNPVNGIPPLSTQSLNTTIIAKDGETIVIGGMYKTENSQSGNKVPFLSRIPIIGNLFKNRLKTGSRKEILIFVTPRIVK